MGQELKQKAMPVDENSSSSDQEQEELGEGLLLESSDNPWMKHVSYIIPYTANCSRWKSFVVFVD